MSRLKILMKKSSLT